jgi:branched-subunit amino acid aminotransferase/4-amino-4-deoxychorismate lyase
VFDDLPEGIYEALRTFEHNRFVGLKAHLDRAQRSMQHFGMTAPLGSQDLRSALHAIATGFAGSDAKIRIDFLSSAATTLGTDCRVIALASELQLPGPEIYAGGVSCELVGQLRRARPQIKESRWVVARRPSEGGTSANFESVLVNPEGQLLEGVMSNFFAVRGGKVLTAPESGVLPGVTRGIVLELVRKLSLPCGEQPIQRGDIPSLQEAFFSTSVRSIVPVVKLDGTTLGSGVPGPVTLQLMEAYGDYCRSEARPAEPEA